MPNKGDIMKRNKEIDYPFVALIGVIYLVIYIVQYTDGIFEKNLAFPQLMLPAVIFSGMFFGDRIGAIFGFFVGAAVDAVSANVICYNCIIMLLVGYFSGILVELLINNNFRSALILSAGFSLLYYFGLWIINGFGSKTFRLSIFPSYISTVFFSLFFYIGFYFLMKLRKKQLQNRN